MTSNKAFAFYSGLFCVAGVEFYYTAHLSRWGAASRHKLQYRRQSRPAVPRRDAATPPKSDLPIKSAKVAP
jgi:hypothetical protein